MADRAGFSATDAALTGFELVRREPLTVLAWSVVNLVVVAPLTWVLSAATAPWRARLNGGGQADPAGALTALGHVLPPAAGVGLVLLLLFGVLLCGVYRSVLRPEGPAEPATGTPTGASTRGRAGAWRAARGWGRLRLGRDELRVSASLVLLALLGAAVTLAAAIAAGVAAALLSMAAPSARGAWVAVSFLAVAALEVFLAVRLSLAPVMSFATGRVRVTGSWALTRGRFWPLLGAYLIVGLLVVAIEIAVFAVLAAAALPFTDLQVVGSLFSKRAQAAQPLALALASTAVNGLLAGFLLALQAGAPASAYAQLAEGAARPPAAGKDLPRFGR